MIWHILRYWISFFLPSFYKRIQASHLERITVNGPVIIAMNHPNAFTDPILITSLVHPLKLKFMARGDVFKPGLITFFLESIGIVPIFRIQDGGKEGLKKNEDAYRRVNHLLSKNSKIIVFAEGLCISERRLRPVKKGVARMVFGAFEAIQNDQLVVVPVGVNYSSPAKLRSNAFYNVGEPIPVKDFMEEYAKNPTRAHKLFLNVLEPRMKALITHINEPENDEAVLQVETLCKRSELLSRGLDPKNLEHDFIVLNELTEKVNAAAIEQPQLLSEFKDKAQRYFKQLQTSSIRDWLLDPSDHTPKNATAWFLRVLWLAVSFPVFALGIIGNYFPFKLTHFITSKMVKNIEFYSSFLIGVAMLLYLLNYFLWFAILFTVFSNLLLTAFVLAVFALSAWFSLYYVPFFKKTLGIYRFIRNKTLITELISERKHLLCLINKF